MENLYNTTTVNNLTEQRGTVGKIVRWLESQFAKTGLGGAMRGRGYKAAFQRVNQELPVNWMKPLTPLPNNVPLRDIFRTFIPGTKSANSKVLKDYFFRISPVPNKAVKQILKDAGLGPAIASIGYGLFLRWAAFALLISFCRLLLSIFASFMPEQIADWIEEYLGVKEFELLSTENLIQQLFNNFVNSIYMPDVFFTIPLYVLVPYITATLSWVFTKAGRSEDPIEYILNAHDRLKSGLMTIIGMTKKIPDNLLEQFPSSERENVKMNDTTIYWKTPDYPIQNLGESSGGRLNLTPRGDDYAMLIPGDGWYRIKDIDFE